MNFAHLHVHTEYSLLDGSNKIKEYVARVKELGMNSAAITDHGSMYGVIDFYKEAKAGTFEEMTPAEILREERLLVENLTVEDCLFEDTTVLDQFTVQGVLMRQKGELLGAIDYLLSL